jgi:ATP-dependent Zn protease
LNETFELASGTLREHRDALDRVASALLEREEISGQKVLELIKAE